MNTLRKLRRIMRQEKEISQKVKQENRVELLQLLVAERKKESDVQKHSLFSKTKNPSPCRDSISLFTHLKLNWDMGCVSSKQGVPVTPAFDDSGRFNSGRIRVGLDCEKGGSDKAYSNNNGNGKVSCCGSELGESGRAESLSFRMRNLSKYIEGEQVAAGWPAWLSAVAGESIQGWVPLKADAFEKLEKIGQGTYSSVFRARELETGRLVALKKVRFDNFEPESVRFMAREILILRRLDHPNVMKLDGLITSRLSCSIYLVFEYMEHDITGLLSCPDAKFSETQIKCYMKQLLSGLDHCHSRGVMHRDIKGSNLLVNNDGILKLGDFGLANFCSYGHRQPLTSRVVTLWYRPPELLLGSTDYGASVDLWSVGCVFAELLLGKPILQGRTEVEQLHKIFKLCGSPPDEYWKKCKLPHATLFKPQQPYDSCLHETFKDIPMTAVDLIGTLLSVEPYKRGTASTALASEYFSTKPYACDPSSIPKYPPSKEIDAKHREDALRCSVNKEMTAISYIKMVSLCARAQSCLFGDRKKITGRCRGIETRKSSRKPSAYAKPPTEDLSTRMQRITKAGDARKPSFDNLEEMLRVKNASQGDIPFSGPLQVSSSSGFAWARRRKDDASRRSHSRSISRGDVSNGSDNSSALQETNHIDPKRQENVDVIPGGRINARGHDSYEFNKRALQKEWTQFERPDSFGTSEEYHSQELSWALYQREEMGARRNKSGFQDGGDKVDFSGPLLSQSHRVDELLERQDRHIRQAVRMSWFRKVKKPGKS